MEEQNEILREVTDGEYKYGFVTDIETEMLPKGLNEAIVRSIAVKKGEPDGITNFRINAYLHCKTLTTPL